MTDETYEKLLDLVKPISISQEVFDEDAPQKRARKDHPPVVSGVQTVAKAAKRPNLKQKPHQCLRHHYRQSPSSHLRKLGSRKKKGKSPQFP